MAAMFHFIENFKLFGQRGTHMRKARWGRAGAKIRSRRKATSRRRGRDAITKKLQRNRLKKGRSIRTGR